MSEINPATAGTRTAVELLTSWMEQDQLGAAEQIERVLNDPNGLGAHNIIAGQCNLGMLLVLWLAQERGARTTDDLRANAAEILRSLSRDVPD
jgi:hypothetical protein